jgi:hypothetical protein
MAKQDETPSGNKPGTGEAKTKEESGAGKIGNAKLAPKDDPEQRKPGRREFGRDG